MPKTSLALPILAALLLLAACSEQAPPPASGPAAAVAERPALDNLRSPAASSAAPAGAPQADAGAAVEELEWDALVPADYRPDKLLEEYKLDELADDDPRAAELMDKLRDLWDQAPVREDLDGRTIRLPGFVVPVEADENETTGFLLVPYYGACIHVPPPPANQTVYVITEAGKGTRPELFDVIWVTGTMSVKRIDNEIAEAGYTLYASEIAPYE
jgi:hypothetical protein